MYYQKEKDSGQVNYTGHHTKLLYLSLSLFYMYEESQSSSSIEQTFSTAILMHS